MNRLVNDEPLDGAADVNVPIARCELLEFARACGWPSYRDQRGYACRRPFDTAGINDIL